MKVRVIADDNIIISNMMMMMNLENLATVDLAVVAVVISSVAILGACQKNEEVTKVIKR